MAIKNRSNLQTTINTNLPNNSAGDITPEKHREVETDLNDSSYNKITDAGLVGLKIYDPSRAYVSNEATVYNSGAGFKVYLSNKATTGTFVGADWEVTEGSVNEAPIDGLSYVRKNQGWSTVADTPSGSIIVNQSNVDTTLGGIIDSTKEYFIDGVIDMGTTQVTIPTTGITLRGYSFDLSGLTSSEDNYTMFISESAVIGSGNILGFDYYVSVTGSSSKVYELHDATGFNAFEFQRINYIDCTSLGDIYEYRQGLETGTGRFGGSPSLTLHGIWLGGYRVTTSIVRSMSDTTTEPLFKEGTLFEMRSRFLTDMNVDLGDLQPLLDFQDSNFPNSSTLQLKGMEVTRGGVYNAEDTNITPNIDKNALSSYWKGNNGILNTYVGGASQITSEETTTVLAGSTYYDLEGIFTGSGLQHFAASTDGKLTHLGDTPIEYEVSASLILESASNDDLTVRFVKWDNSASSFINLDYTAQTRQVNNFQGGRDVANFTILSGATLSKNDFLKIQVKNNSGNNDIIAESSSFYRVQER